MSIFPHSVCWTFILGLFFEQLNCDGAQSVRQLERQTIRQREEPQLSIIDIINLAANHYLNT